jgi:hypothetical protein
VERGQEQIPGSGGTSLFFRLSLFVKYPAPKGTHSRRAVLLGRFEIMLGVLTGNREVAGPALVEFLNRDTNGLATFILVRETVSSGRHDLVHGFAG